MSKCLSWVGARRFQYAALGCLLMMAWSSAALAGDAASKLDPAYQRDQHVVVLLTDEGLSPRVANLDEGQLVAWISYSKIPTTIVFASDVARAMICHSLVNFEIEDGALRSAQIMPGEFASFCQLKPGRYRYEVLRAVTDPGPPDRFEGEIVVGDPD